MKRILTDIAEIAAILRQALVCRIALCDDGRPYVMPVCFGYEDNTLYFHSSPTGSKVDFLKKSNAVCFEADVDREIVRADKACQWRITYRSVIGFGKAFLIEAPQEKRRALDVIMAHYGGDPPLEYPEVTLEKTAVVRIAIETMTAKIAT